MPNRLMVASQQCAWRFTQIGTTAPFAGFPSCGRDVCRSLGIDGVGCLERQHEEADTEF